MIKLLFVCLILLSACSKKSSEKASDNGNGNPDQEVNPDESSITPEMGGSNYAFIDLGKYAVEPTDENWANHVKTPITHYHQYVRKVREQLDWKIQNGQKKIALIVWFNGPGQKCDFYMHTVCPQGGKLPPQAEANLQGLLKEIVSRDFKEVQIRMGGQGKADIHGWSDWEEEVYQSNKNFILDVIEKSNKVLADSSIQVYYDLGLELMGHPHIERSWYKRYLIQVWNQYLKLFDPKNTIGFSFNHAHRNALYDSLKIFDESGVRPPRLGFDIYVDRKEHYENIELVFQLKGWGKDYPIFIQETYRNDIQIAQEILDLRNNRGLNILSIMQWPLDQGASGHSNSVDYTFDNYK